MNDLRASKLAQWRRAACVRHASIALACAALAAFGIVAVGARVGGLRMALAVGVVVVVVAAIAAWRFAKRADDAALARRLDAHAATLEDSAALLWRDSRTLTPLQNLQRARLETRLADIRQPADPGRLEQELVLQITRMDVDEELDRLSTHITEARRVLALKEPVGRRLDFLMQEFNREANTLGSKSVDSRTTNAAVELKVLIEQMREQVQNIE